jgi:hypothetical protein
MGATIWIVFQALNDAGNTVFIALEVNYPVTLFVPTTVMANRNSASVVTPA